MKSILRELSIALLLSCFAGVGMAGPAVVPNPKSPVVKVWDDKFVVVQEFADPAKIRAMQDIFLRSKRVGDTASHLKAPTHKIDFSDRWLLDIRKGELGLLSKTVVDVYRINPKDLKPFQKLIGTKVRLQE